MNIIKSCYLMESQSYNHLISVTFICDMDTFQKLSKYHYISEENKAIENEFTVVSIIDSIKLLKGTTVTFSDSRQIVVTDTIIDFWNEQWLAAQQQSELRYFALINSGCPVEIANSVLTLSLKSEITITMDLRGWKHFLFINTHSSVSPQLKELAIALLDKFKKSFPDTFEDLDREDA